jgi:hypothetical protein
MEYYSTTVKNEIMSFSDKWVELETTMLSKVSEFQKKAACFLSYMEDRHKT